MTDDFFIKQLEKLAEEAGKKRDAKQARFDSHSESWQEGEQGQDCQNDIEFWDTKVDEIQDIIDSFDDDSDEEDD